MAALGFRRLPASSLLEVTVATAILVLVFGLALGSLARLTSTGPRPRQLKGQQLLAHLAAQTIRQRAWYARTWHAGEWEVVQRVAPSPTTPRLLTLHLTASVGSQAVAQYYQLVYVVPQPAAP